MIKRTIAVCLMFLTAAFATGCTSAQEQESSLSDNTAATVRLGGLKGPTCALSVHGCCLRSELSAVRQKRRDHRVEVAAEEIPHKP